VSRLIGVFFLLWALQTFAQQARPLPAPDDLMLQFSTVGDQHDFHLGELIPVSHNLMALTPSKYLYVSLPGKLAGGSSFDVTCDPGGEKVLPMSPDPNYQRLSEILSPSCIGNGVGGGVGGGCGDCDYELPITSNGLSFGPMPLNLFVRFRRPGIYSCTGNSAQVTATAAHEKLRPALLVRSKPLLLKIVDDAGWSQAAIAAYAQAFAKNCRGDDVPQKNFQQCSDISRRITYLDTAEAIDVEASEYDGRNHGWDTGFWDAIQHSSNRGHALRRLRERFPQPDFQVSTSVVDWLTITDLRLENADAFENAPAIAYQEQALEKLRKYVRLLGGSLEKKNSSVVTESVKTYRYYAEQSYCKTDSLIPLDERTALLKRIGVSDQR
jgi:hypothetical protein